MSSNSSLLFHFLLGLVFPKFLIKPKDTVEQSELPCIVAAIPTVMKIMVVVSRTEGKQLQGSPSEHIPRMAIIGIPHSQHNPDNPRIYVDGPEYFLCQHHVDSSSNSIGKEKLNDMAVQPCNGHSCGILMMNFVVFIEPGSVKHPVRWKEHQILHYLKHQEMR